MDERRPTSASSLADASCAAIADAVADEPRIVAAWLFGSIALGRSGSLSDVDVALALVDGTDGEAVCARVADRLARCLHTDAIDLVLFDRASIDLRYRIVRDGRRVVCRDPAACERLTAEAVMRYLDFRPVREQAFRAMRDAIARGK